MSLKRSNINSIMMEKRFCEYHLTETFVVSKISQMIFWWRCRGASEVNFRADLWEERRAEKRTHSHPPGESSSTAHVMFDWMYTKQQLLCAWICSRGRSTLSAASISRRTLLSYWGVAEFPHGQTSTSATDNFTANVSFCWCWFPAIRLMQENAGWWSEARSDSNQIKTNYS